MKIYTRGGDEGQTGLFGGDRVAKDDPRVEAYGRLDELNSVVGLARVVVTDPEVSDALLTIQNELFVLGAEVASCRGKEVQLSSVLSGNAVERIERLIDAADDELPALKSFILPGGSEASRALARMSNDLSIG